MNPAKMVCELRPVINYMTKMNKLDKVLKITYIAGIVLVILAIIYKLYLIPGDQAERLIFFASGEYAQVQYKARLLSFAGLGLFFVSIITTYIITKIAKKKN
jgi:hypothetical protein